MIALRIKFDSVKQPYYILAHLLQCNIKGKPMTLLPEISAAEFRVLKTLWKKHPLSVREVHDTISATTGWAYSTTKTTMDRMVKKGLLQRASFHGVFIYHPLVTKSYGMAKWVRFVAEGLLDTDYARVVSMFSANGALTDSEAEELLQLLENDGEADYA